MYLGILYLSLGRLATYILLHIKTEALGWRVGKQHSVETCENPGLG